MSSHRLWVKPREKVRRRGFEMLKAEISKAEISRKLHVAYKTVWQWELRLRRVGSEAWRDRKQPGRPMRLTDAQRGKLLEILLGGAQRYGFETDLWTLKRVAHVIKCEFNIAYNVTHVWRVLRDLGLTAQVPLKQALERDEAYIEKWLRKKWPRLYRKARKKKAKIVFVDESGVSNEPNVVRTWAPKGSRPRLTHSAKHEKLSSISGVTEDAELYFTVHSHDLTGKDVIRFLKLLLKRTPQPLMLLWDNATIHRSKDVKEYICKNREKIECHRFPPYAPELNPNEYVISHLKYRELANFCPTSEAELKNGLKKAIKRLKRKPQLIRRLIQGSPLLIGKL
jgi:transposase